MSHRKIAVPTLFVISLSVVVIAVFWIFDLVINVTPSMPVGIWRVFSHPVNASDLKGRIILICPPKNEIFSWAIDQEIISGGRCKTGSIPLLKEVLGVPGDNIDVYGDKVFLNENLAARRHFEVPSRIFSEIKSYKIPENHVWVLGTSREESFDSRYFGPLSLDGFIGVVRPILVWNG